MSKKPLNKKCNKEERKKRVDDLFNELEEGFIEDTNVKLLEVKDVPKQSNLVSRNINEIVKLTEQNKKHVNHISKKHLNFLDPEQATKPQHDIWCKKLKSHIQKWSTLSSRVRDKEMVNRHLFFHSFEAKYLKKLNKETNIAIYRLVNASLQFFFELIESDTPIPHINLKQTTNKRLAKLGVFNIQKVSDGHAINVVIENKLINKIDNLAKLTGTNKSIVVNWALNSVIALVYDKTDLTEDFN